MELFIDWISTNWQWVASVGASLLYFILLLLFKNRPTYYGYYLDIVRKVKEAESMFVGTGRGDEKSDWVANEICRLHDMKPNKFNKDSIKYAIDDVMSTPKKKGGK